MRLVTFKLKLLHYRLCSQASCRDYTTNHWTNRYFTTPKAHYARTYASCIAWRCQTKQKKYYSRGTYFIVVYVHDYYIGCKRLFVLNMGFINSWFAVTFNVNLFPHRTSLYDLLNPRYTGWFKIVKCFS